MREYKISEFEGDGSYVVSFDIRDSIIESITYRFNARDKYITQLSVHLGAGPGLSNEIIKKFGSVPADNKSKLYYWDEVTQVERPYSFTFSSRQADYTAVWDACIEIDSNVTDAINAMRKKINREPPSIMQIVESSGLESAIKFALEQWKENKDDYFPLLAKYFKENGKTVEYLTVLQAFPSDHPEFKKVNQELLKQILLLTIPEKPNEKVIFLETRFIFAMHAGDVNATQYLNDVAGAPVVTRPVTGNDPEVYLEMAKVIREQRGTIELLQQNLNQRNSTSASSSSVRFF